MVNLRLVFDNENGERKDITLPMERWIVDWWYDCNIVPSNDTEILVAELDGNAIPIIRYVQFDNIAFFFNWDILHNDFIKEVNKNSNIRNNSTDFEKWLLENIEGELKKFIREKREEKIMKCWRVLYKPDNTAFMVWAETEQIGLDKVRKRNLKELENTEDSLEDYIIDEFTLETNGTGMLVFYDVYSVFERNQ